MIKLLETPPTRFPDRPLNEATERWWVAKVKPRQEKLLAMDFLQESVEYFLPIIIKNTPRPGSKSPRTFNVPLFPGYICFSQNAPRSVYSSGRVVNIIEVRNQSRFISECDQIYRVLQGNYPLEQFEEYVEGQLVKVEYGPLRGLQGVISKRHGNSRIVLCIEGLGRAALTIDSSWVRSVEEEMVIAD